MVHAAHSCSSFLLSLSLLLHTLSTAFCAALHDVGVWEAVPTFTLHSHSHKPPLPRVDVVEHTSVFFQQSKQYCPLWDKGYACV